MTTFKKTSHISTVRDATAPDFVSSDSAALATHMNHCANGRGRFFDFFSTLESAHSLFSSRMVTCALVAVVAVGALGLVGMV